LPETILQVTFLSQRAESYLQPIWRHWPQSFQIPWYNATLRPLRY